MGVVREWECKTHGYFESTHPICFALGCDSSQVKRVFLTAPAVGSPELKRFHEGLKKSADLMGIGNFRSAREGESAFGNSGKGLLWGDDIQKVLGVGMTELTSAAATPFTVTHQDGTSEKINKSVLREMAQSGEPILAKRGILPKPAELIRSKAEK